jgi:hypothetical protein
MPMDSISMFLNTLHMSNVDGKQFDVDVSPNNYVMTSF